MLANTATTPRRHDFENTRHAVTGCAHAAAVRPTMTGTSSFILLPGGGERSRISYGWRLRRLPASIVCARDASTPPAARPPTRSTADVDPKQRCSNLCSTTIAAVFARKSQRSDSVATFVTHCGGGWKPCRACLRTGLKPCATGVGGTALLGSLRTGLKPWTTDVGGTG